jgi:regulator of Ty1 transposition protein 103
VVLLFMFLNSYAALSRWCIFHRKRAKRVVDTWEKQFTSAREDKKISFLYLSNDILQNSKRKGADYVDEFWRVLPRSLKHVYEKGGGEGKNQVARLVGLIFFCYAINSLHLRSTFILELS